VDTDWKADVQLQPRSNTIQKTGPTAAAKGSGSAAIKKERQDKAMLFMRDNWYFPMYFVSDQCFHDWLK
jgi:hypothetical protein